MTQPADQPAPRRSVLVLVPRWALKTLLEPTGLPPQQQQARRALENALREQP